MNGQYDIYDGQMESILVSKVARLKDDGSSLAPGAYDVAGASKVIAQSPKGGVKWENVKSKRGEHFIKTYTTVDVGPGKYTARTSNTSIMNPTIPRASEGARTTYKHNSKPTIPTDFEEEDDEP